MQPNNQNGSISDIRPQRSTPSFDEQVNRPPVQSPRIPSYTTTQFQPEGNGSGKKFLWITLIVLLLAGAFCYFKLGMTDSVETVNLPPPPTTAVATTTTTTMVSSSDDVAILEQELNATTFDDSDAAEIDTEFEAEAE